MDSLPKEILSIILGTMEKSEKIYIPLVCRLLKEMCPPASSDQVYVYRAKQIIKGCYDEEFLLAKSKKTVYSRKARNYQSYLIDRKDKNNQYFFKYNPESSSRDFKDKASFIRYAYNALKRFQEDGIEVTIDDYTELYNITAIRNEHLSEDISTKASRFILSLPLDGKRRRDIKFYTDLLIASSDVSKIQEVLFEEDIDYVYIFRYCKPEFVTAIINNCKMSYISDDICKNLFSNHRVDEVLQLLDTRTKEKIFNFLYSSTNTSAARKKHILSIPHYKTLLLKNVQYLKNSFGLIPIDLALLEKSCDYFGQSHVLTRNSLKVYNIHSSKLKDYMNYITTKEAFKSVKIEVGGSTNFEMSSILSKYGISIPDKNIVHLLKCYDTNITTLEYLSSVIHNVKSSALKLDLEKDHRPVFVRLKILGYKYDVNEVLRNYLSRNCVISLSVATKIRFLISRYEIDQDILDNLKEKGIKLR